MNYGCDLCKLVQGDVITKEYYSDDLIVVVDCMTCGVPMGMIKKHKIGLNPAEHQRLTIVMLGVGEKVFGRGKFYIDRNQRRIKTHLHWHCRKKV